MDSSIRQIVREVLAEQGQKLSVQTPHANLFTDDYLYGITNPNAPSSVKIPVSAFDNRYTQVYNPLNFGAKGDNTTDDTDALQETLDQAHASAAAGAIIFLPSFFKITKNLQLYSNITLQGIGMEISGIRQVTSGQDAIFGQDCSSLNFFDLSVLGNGSGNQPGSNGIGIHLEWLNAGNNPFHNFRNVEVRNHGSDGIRIRTPIVSGFDKVYSAYNGNHGFNWYEGGTSCQFKNCWARENSAAGYRWNQSVYQSLTGCAADNNGIGYLIQSAQSIGFHGCGAEGQLKNGDPYNGIGWKIDNSSVIDLAACWITDNRNLGVWVTDGSQGVDLQVADNTPNATAQYFIQTDIATNTTIRDQHNTSANNLLGAVLILNDGDDNHGAISSPTDLLLKANGSGLVRTTVLRQDDTTNTYQIGNTVILTGWGVMQGASNQLTETITFGKTFAQRPIVVAVWGGDSVSNATSYGSGGNNSKGLATCKAEVITTTGFDIRIRTVDGTSWGATDAVFYQWFAIGELA